MSIPSLRSHPTKPLRDEHAEREAFAVALETRPELFRETERAVVQAVFFEGRSTRAAAEHLGLPRPTLVDRLNAARRTLRALNGEGDPPTRAQRLRRHDQIVDRLLR